MQSKHIITFILTAIVALSLSYCEGGSGLNDRLLYGFTADTSNSAIVSPENTCTTDVTVQSTTVSLIEQGSLGGDQTRAWQSSSPYYTDTDTNGGSSYGLFRQEVCIYLVQPFNGDVEIPVSVDADYSSYLTIQKTFPVVEAGNPLPSTLTFTGDGTTGHGDASRQCFNIEAISDVNITGESLNITLGTITTADDEGVYTDKDPCDISVSVEDDDGPGVRVSNISNIMEEPGGSGSSSGTFRVRLRTAPTANVTMAVNDLYDSTNASHREGTADKSSLTFTNGNFATEQIVTINSVDDLEVDGQKIYTVAVENTSSADPDYNGLNPRDVVVINDDKSVPGYTYVRFDTTGGSTTSGSAGTITGFATDEKNNFSTSYSNWTMQLRSKPQTNVTLNFSNSRPDISNLLTSSLTFTPSNWNTPQTVYVEGKPDMADGVSGYGNVDYTISFTVTTTDPTYSTIPRPSFSIRSCDNDFNHLIQPCNFSGSPFGTTGNRFSAAESPTEATTHIWLISQNDPGAGATVALSSTDTSEGTVLSGTGSGSATINSSNYASMVAGSANQIVMTHKDELILDGSQNWTVTTAGSGGTISYNTADINATTTDNEQLYYMNVSGSTKEADGGVTATISLCLGSNNASSVEIAAACSGDECGGVTPGTVTFAPGSAITAAPASNAACATDPNRQTFTVTGADDLFADGTQTFTVNLTETGTYADATYDGQNPGSSGNINNADNETPGKAVYPLPITVRGEFTAAGVNGADDICNSNKPGYAPSGTYKALIISNSGGELLNDRLATTDGSTSAGDPNWTLKADYYYYRCDGSGYSNCSDEHKRLFKANSAALIPFPMDRYFSSNSGHIFWTGMNANMTPATQTMTPAGGGLNPVYGHNCSGFTYLNQPLSPNATYYGQTWSDAGSGNITSNTNIDCNTYLRLICVQQ